MAGKPASHLSIGSFACVGGLLSAMSIASILSWRSRRAIRSSPSRR